MPHIDSSPNLPVDAAYQSIYHLLSAQAKQNPDAISIAAPGRNPLSYRRLFMHINDMVNVLNSKGIGRNDRVAIVLPNGPEMAVTFLTVAAGATSAPLNPNYGVSEFEFYLSDLKAKTLIVQTGLESPARSAAEKCGIPIIELIPTLDAEAGIFTFEGECAAKTSQTGFAQPDDVALVLHTSGTTSRPKIVP
ncbi:unnamed protein product, partial [marine sediment metagenome]